MYHISNVGEQHLSESLGSIMIMLALFNLHLPLKILLSTLENE